MAFGIIFGALFFGLLCGWLGLQFVQEGDLAAKIGGSLLSLLGVLLAVGLLRRCSWARWLGLVVAAGMVLFAGRLVQLRGDALDQLVLFSALITTVLLALPVTGDVRRGLPEEALARRGAGKALGWAALASALGLAGVIFWGYSDGLVEQPANGPVEISELARVNWTDFGSGIELSQQRRRPMLVSFNASWCGYCKKMDRTTWRDPAVIALLNEVVPVRIDVESTRELRGFTGFDVAGRYQVSSTPTTILIDGGGNVIARQGGYLSARELLNWVESSLPARASTIAGAAADSRGT